MILRKSFILILICMFAMALAFSADKKVTISFWHLDTQDDYKAVWQKLADGYMAKNPNVKVEITVLANQSFKEKIATVMQSGNPPDIFRSWGGGVMNEYAKAGLLKEITKDLSGTDWGNSFGKGPLSVYSFQNKYYGVPYDMGAVGIWYNKAIFAKLGIKPFATWDDLISGVKKIKAAGIIPIALGEGDKWPGHFWWVYLATRIGGKDAFLKATTKKGAFADAPYVQAGEKLKELIDLQPFQNGFLASVYNDEAMLVGTGKAAMELMGQWAPGVEQQQTTDKKGIGKDLGFMPFPAVKGGAGKITDTMGGGNGYVIGKNAPKEAVDFLRYITTLENYINIVNSPMSVIPVIKGADKQIKDANTLAVISSVANADYYQLYYDQYLPPEVASTVLDAVQGIYAGTKTPLDAAKMIDKSMADNLK